MKFITEEDLRDLYREKPFTNYELNPGERLTPGGRQFLLDRGINMYDDNNKKAVHKETTQPRQAEAASPDMKGMKLCSRMKTTEATFLLTGQELLERDICLAQSITGLARQFSAIKNAVNGQCQAVDLCCTGCTSITVENFDQDLGDCFEITEFHMGLDKGREILLLHRLRCVLRELEVDVMELSGEQCQWMTGKINQIINALSQMICTAFGGKECQKKD